MKKLLFIIFYFSYITIFAQKIVIFRPDKNIYSPLNKSDRVFFFDSDTIKNDTNTVLTYIQLKIFGKKSTFQEDTYGLIRLSELAHKKVREMGYNGVSMNYYKKIENSDTLSLNFYKLNQNFYQKLSDEPIQKNLTVINPEYNKPKDISIDNKDFVIENGYYYSIKIDADYSKIKLGSGLLSSHNNISFKEKLNHYYLIDGYSTTPPPGGMIGFGISSPTIHTIGKIAGEIITRIYKKYTPKESIKSK
jgi:hypothetical protein